MPQHGTVHYHQRNGQRPVYHIDAGGIPGALLGPEHAVVDVEVRDVRQGEATVSFDEDGLAFEHAPSQVIIGESRDWQRGYDREIAALLKRELGAEEVVVFDHTIRVDDPSTTRRPARNVHSDYSPDGAERRLIDILGPAKAEAWSRGHYAFINVWRPLEAPINSAPLAFVRPSSVPDEDWILVDLVYPDRRGHIMGLVANRAHEWVYQSRMTPDEVAFFNIYDNRGMPSVGHSAVDLVEDETIHTIRKSIETRTVVRLS